MRRLKKRPASVARAAAAVPLGREMFDYFADNVAKLAVEPHGIIAMDAGNQVGAFPDVSAVFFIPFDPLVVAINHLQRTHPR
jgi:hypothetical protein